MIRSFKDKEAEKVFNYEVQAMPDLIPIKEESERRPPVHPGEILRELFLKPGGISIYRLAKGTGLSQTKLGEILRGKRGITAETALRLARFYGNSAQFWLGIQAQYDLRVAEDKLADRLDSEVTPLQDAG